jgi:hypothetical protein
LAYVLDPGNWRRVYLTLKNMKKHANLLDIPYFSGSPFLFGEGQAVKFGVTPQHERQSKLPSKPTDYFLRERLMEDVENREFHLNFNVQFQMDSRREPVEDTSRQWKSPWLKLATIKIPIQQFTAQEQLMFGENRVFSPWQCLAAHRPLGGINWARRDVYKMLSDFRLRRNAVSGFEDTSDA